MVGNISDRQAEIDTTAQTPAILGLLIAKRHSAVPQSAISVRSIAGRR